MATIRLNFIVEGQTEEAFVNTVLRDYLVGCDVLSSVRCVQTSRHRNIKHSGGIRRYAQAKRDIERWLRSDANSDARFTTMFDLYALPDDFPGYADTAGRRDPYDRVNALENALADDINDSRFTPYLQLHEFEALLLAGPRQLESQFGECDVAIQRLDSAVADFGSPELVNNGRDTAPSKRIIAEIPGYADRKASAGPIIAGRIGLAVLRARCPHFGQWLDRLQGLALPQNPESQ